MASASEPFALDVRKRVETGEGSKRFHAVAKPETWNPAKTAIIVCDVWDLHHSRNATLRTGELAPVIDKLVKEVRKRGGTVIHCPSDTMAHYEGHPAGIAAQKTPKASNLPEDITTWCHSIPAEEQGTYPIDQSDGGGDDDANRQEEWLNELKAKGRNPAAPWIKQHDAIAIEAGDYVTDKGDEVWSILEARGIDNILMTGVHTNMCVLGRPFGLRRLATGGKNVVLVRDLTDTMYNPAKSPFVSHFTGTDLIVEHIEKYVCGTITSDQVLGGEPFRFEGDKRATAVVVVSEPEYGTEKTLPAFAARHLGHQFRVRFVFGDDEDGDSLPGIEDALVEADVLLLSVRRRSPPFDQMKAIRKFIESGKPVVGIRTANHAFSLKGETPPEGKATWEEFDKDVFGGNYTNHYGAGPEVDLSMTGFEEQAVGHPILTGIGFKGWTSSASLYKVSPLAESAVSLIRGKLSEHPAEPVAWMNTTTFGGKAFYTSLGAASDFESGVFRRLLFNALFWATGREIPKTMPDATTALRGDGEARDRESSPQSSVPRDAPLSLGRGAGGEGRDDASGALSNTPPNRDDAVQEQTPSQDTPSPLTPLPRERGTDVAALLQENGTVAVSTAETDTASSPAPPVSPTDTFTVPNDLVWEPALTDPDIAQPVFMSFDERGRLWVAEYRQYPYPAGLKMLSKDSHWRAVYDKVPVAPPHHERGADRISIHEDADGDGTFDKHTTFVEGLSLATSFARGRGGVWVLNPPYLLFYPDANNDDVPDGDPVVHLEGFGIEDTHSCANSLTFGPDGWLYGCQGSTVSGRIVRPGTDDKPVVTMGQLIWRYHPEQKTYEVFAEGGGNAFGLEIGANGNIYSGHNGGDTRGFHYVQGGYYRKGFEKHGALSNPHAYGFFEPMEHPKVPRFTHDFVIYEGDALPAKYRGKLFGVEPLQGQVTLTEITPNGSTFKTNDLDRVVKSEGDTFRPVNIATGPDGAIYVADFHEHYIAHRDHFEGRINKETGRIYRLRAKDTGQTSEQAPGRDAPLSLGRGAGGEGSDHASGALSNALPQRDDAIQEQAPPQDNPSPLTPLPRERGTDATDAQETNEGSVRNLAKLSPNELVALLEHPNRWHRQTALRLIADVGDDSVVPHLREKLLASGGRQPSENDVARDDKPTRRADAPRSPVDILWALYQLGGLDVQTTLARLDHADPIVREWTVRLTCDDRRVEPAIATRLAAMAKTEPDVRVRVQLACSARRLPVEPCLSIVDGLLRHDADTADPLLPLSLWWAVEAHCDKNAPAVAAMFSQRDVWSRELAWEQFAWRLMRRFASGSRAQLALCADLLRAAPNDDVRRDVRRAMLAGFEEAFRGRPAAALPEELVAVLAETGGLPLSLRVRRGEAEAIAAALQRVGDASRVQVERVELAALLGESRSPEALPVLLTLFDSSDAKLRQAGLAAIAGYGDDVVGDALLAALPKRSPAEQIAIVSVLVSRADWSQRLVETLASGEVPKDVVPADLVRRLTLHDDATLTAAAKELWPELADRETQTGRDVASLTATIVAEHGDPYAGRRLFLEACSRCHKLFGEGGEVGPDLTSDPRNDLNRLLGSIVKPSAEIREGFETWVAVTSEGRVISGLLIDQDEHVVVLRENDGRSVLLRRDEVEDLVRQPQSLMPDRLLDQLTDQEVRDLFAYLRSSQPLNDAR